MHTTYRGLAWASVLALGLSTITVPIAAADPVPVPSSVQTTGFGMESGMSVGFGTGDTSHSTKVRLITGDTVYIDDDGEVTGVVPGPRPDGTFPQFAKHGVEDNVYVIPSDAIPMIGNQLDRELFNVTRLKSYDLGDSIPVIVTPADDDNTVTPDVSGMGVDVTNTLDAASAQTGLADAHADSAPAPAWALLDELDTAPASPDDRVSSTTMVWLDRRYDLDLQSDPDPDLPPPVWMNTIGADQAHEDGLTGEGVVVGIVDTGVDANHPDLVGQVIAERDFTDSGSAGDANGHGTFVASEIVGTGAASGGTYVGVAPGAKLINARVIDASGTGEDSGVIAGLEWTCQQGADIVNMSLGDPSTLDDGSSFMSQAVNRISRQYGCLIVIAAGNGWGSQVVSAPGTADEALTVGATCQDGALAQFSSAGPRRGDGAVKPEIMAPGAAWQIIYDDGFMDYMGMVGAQADGQGYMTAYGTSMATPLVAGAAALVKQSDPTLDRTDIRAKLMASAQDLYRSVFYQGAGMVNIPAAVSQQVTTSPTQVNFGGFDLPYPENASATLTYVNDSDNDLTFDLTTNFDYVQSLGLPTLAQDDEEEPAYARAATAEQMMPEDVFDYVSLSTDQLTIPAGGTASVEVSIVPSGFAEGYGNGYVIATSDDGTQMRTPFGWGNKPQTAMLSVSATSHNGTPFSGTYNSFISIINMETGMWEDVSATSDTMKILVIPGEYKVYVYMAEWKSDNSASDVTILLPSQVSVEADTVLDIRGTQTQPVTISTDQPVDNGTIVTSAAVGGHQWFSGSFTQGFSRDTVYVSPDVDPSWGLQVATMMASPLVDATIDECGQSSLPVSAANPVLPAGQHSYSLVDGLAGPVPGKATAAVVQVDDPNATEDLIAIMEQVGKGGYDALIVASAQPVQEQLVVQAVMSLFPSEFGYEFQVPVFVTTHDVSDQLRAATTINMLIRDQYDYIYFLAQEFDAPPYALVGSDQNTAEIAVTHRGVDHMSEGDVFFSFPTTSSWVSSLSVGLAGSLSYTAYVQSDRMTRMYSYMLFDGEITTTTVPDRYFGPSDSVAVDFGIQVQSAGSSDERGPVKRVGDEIYGAVPWFIDGQGLPESARSSGLATVSLSLTDVTTGETLLAGNDLTDFRAGDLSGSSHIYRLDETTGSSVRALSTDVTSSWTWQSAYADAVVEPLRQVWYELPGLDADNAGSPEQAVVIHAGQQNNSTPVPVDQVSLEMSTDGGSTWTPVPVQHTGSDVTDSGSVDLFSGTISAQVGQMVSLRSSVSGGGSDFDQTVMNAYPVTSSPRNFPAPVTWSCGGGGENTTPPDPPTVTGANSYSVYGFPGSTEPGETVTVTFPDGTTGTAVAEDDGSYVVATPAGMVSGQISVRATDASGNVSDPTTLWLDADRPDPARIDRADLVEVSGGVGAAEAFSLVTIVFPDGTPLATTAEENGSYAIPTPAGMILGTVTVIVCDAAGNNSDPSTAQLVQPSPLALTLRYPQLDPGGSQVVVATGFRPWERVTVSLCTTTGCTTVITVLASYSGKVSTSFLVPQTATAGMYTVTLTGSASGVVSATFEVVAPTSSSQCWLDLVVSIWRRVLGL